MNAETPAGESAKAPKEIFAAVYYNADDHVAGACVVALDVGPAHAVRLKAAVFKKFPVGAIVAQVYAARDMMVSEFRRPSETK